VSKSNHQGINHFLGVVVNCQGNLFLGGSTWPPSKYVIFPECYCEPPRKQPFLDVNRQEKKYFYDFFQMISDGEVT
jgi:hypothetical protein